MNVLKFKTNSGQPSIHVIQKKKMRKKGKRGKVYVNEQRTFMLSNHITFKKLLFD